MVETMQGRTEEFKELEKQSTLEKNEFSKGLGNHEMLDDRVKKEIMTDGLRARMQEMRQDVLEQVNDRINDMVSEILQRVEMVKPWKTDELVNSKKYCDKVKSSSGSLPDKHFLERDSLLTELFEIKHIRTIYNIFVVILIFLFINTAIHDIMDTGSPNLGIDTIRKGFGKFSIVLCIWILMKGSTLCTYAAFCYWAHQRLEYPPNSRMKKVWDYGWLAILIFYNIMFVVLPTKSLVDEDLPIASSVIILMEQVRMLMKLYAFVRSTAPRFLSYKPHAEAAIPKTPGFSQFLYFLFAPTLIYRDSYPRSKKIRWKTVVENYSEVILILFYVAFTFERFMLPTFVKFGTEPVEWRWVILNMFTSIIPAMLLMLCGFYCLLHSWMNGSAELLRFADRMFYKDWWNSTSYGAYYRTWNVVVHDWLYNYIYKDMYQIVTNKNKPLSIIAVFAVSALFHEYILAFSFRFFYPVMLSMFGGLGLFFVFVTRRAGNIFFWLTMCTGSSFIVSAYCMEYYARINCPPYPDEFLDLFIPRSWFCISIKSS